jgi:hypothetical protein
MDGSGFEQLLADNKIEVLRLVYEICSRVPQQGPAAIRALLQQHIKSAGQVRCPQPLRSAAVSRALPTATVCLQQLARVANAAALAVLNQRTAIV